MDFWGEEQKTFDNSVEAWGICTAEKNEGNTYVKNWMIKLLKLKIFTKVHCIISSEQNDIVNNNYTNNNSLWTGCPMPSIQGIVSCSERHQVKPGLNHQSWGS